MVEKSNNGILKISGRIDSNNAAEFEKELFAAAGEEKDNITIDVADTEYISSAGLRVFLRLKKTAAGEVSVINASPAQSYIDELTKAGLF